MHLQYNSSLPALILLHKKGDDETVEI